MNKRFICAWKDHRGKIHERRGCTDIRRDRGTVTLFFANKEPETFSVYSFNQISWVKEELDDV